MIPISTFGKLNGLCKEKQYFWGVTKNSWEDFYHVEVSSQNFDKRPSLHENVDHIDDALEKMIKHIELI